MFRFELGSRTILLTLLAAIGWGGYQALNLVPDEDAGLRTAQAAALARQVSLALPELAGRPQVVISPIRGDHRQLLDTKCRKWVARRNVQVVPPSVWRNAVALTGQTVAPANAAAAVEQFSTAYPEGFVLFGDVQEWITFPQSEAHLTAHIQLMSLETGAAVYDAIVSVPPKPPTPASSTPAAATWTEPLITAWTWRDILWGFIAWGAGVFLAPWLCGGLIGPLLARESNTVNAPLLAVLVLLATAAAWFCWTRGLAPDFAPLATLVAGTGATLYLGYACGQLHALQRT